MSTTDLLARWSTLSLDEIKARLSPGADCKAVELGLGAGEAEVLRAVTQQPQVRGARQVVVLLPGVMGSLLTSILSCTFRYEHTGQGEGRLYLRMV